MITAGKCLFSFPDTAGDGCDMRLMHQPARISASRRQSLHRNLVQLMIALRGTNRIRGLLAAEPRRRGDHREVKNLREHKRCHGYADDCTCRPTHRPTGCRDSNNGDRHATDEFRDVHSNVSVCRQQIGPLSEYGSLNWSTLRSISTTPVSYQSDDMMQRRSVSHSPHLLVQRLGGQNV